MKGKTKCPKCYTEFIIELPSEIDRHFIVCPECKHSFVVKKTCEGFEEKECGWEEYGEPRKTILSSKRNLSNKPIISSFFLLTTGVLGIFTAVIFYSSSEAIISEFEFVNSYLSNINLNEFVLFALLLIFSFFSITGSILSYIRKSYPITILCAIFGIFSIGLFVGIALCISSIILIFLSRDEFEDATKGKIF